MTTENSSALTKSELVERALNILKAAHKLDDVAIIHMGSAGKPNVETNHRVLDACRDFQKLIEAHPEIAGEIPAAEVRWIAGMVSAITTSRQNVSRYIGRRGPYVPRPHFEPLAKKSKSPIPGMDWY
jgi:hypothetical protein